MSSFLSSIIAPHQEGTVLVHVPLQVLTADEARELAEQMNKCAEIATRAKAEGTGVADRLRQMAGGNRHK